MPAKDLGSKHTCYKCGTKFYDMKKPVPVCPKCGADQRESPALKSPPPAEKRTRAAKPVEPLVDAEDAADLEEELEGDDDDADDADDDDDA